MFKLQAWLFSCLSPSPQFPAPLFGVVCIPQNSFMHMEAHTHIDYPPALPAHCTRFPPCIMKTSTQGMENDHIGLVGWVAIARHTTAQVRRCCSLLSQPPLGELSVYLVCFCHFLKSPTRFQRLKWKQTMGWPQVSEEVRIKTGEVGGGCLSLLYSPPSLGI